MFPLYDDNPTRRPPIFTVLFIAVNCLIFALTFRMSPEQLERLYFRHGFLPVRASSLGAAKTLVYEREAGPPLVLPVTTEAVGLTLLSCMFLHGGLLHVAGNMWFLWIFGNNIEDRLGHVTFFLFYIIGGGIADLCHWGMAPAALADVPTIGASGAVAVMLGAYIVTYPMAKVRTIVLLCVIPLFVRIPAYILLGIWILLQLLEASVAQEGIATNVAFWAHIGGFFTGMLIMPLLAAGTPEPGQDWKREADSEFDFSNIQTEDRLRARQAALQRDEIQWEDSRRTLPPSRPASPDITWDDRSR